MLSCKIVHRLKREARNADTGRSCKHRQKADPTSENISSVTFGCTGDRLTNLMFLFLQQNKGHLLLTFLYFFSSHPIFMKTMHHSDCCIHHQLRLFRLFFLLQSKSNSLFKIGLINLGLSVLCCPIKKRKKKQQTKALRSVSSEWRNKVSIMMVNKSLRSKFSKAI